jgi:ATP-dependent helicase HrpA
MTNNHKRPQNKSRGVAEDSRRRRIALEKISYPPHLPIAGKKEDIIRAIKMNQVVVITGETGSGKTTQIPKMCLEAGRGIRGMIGCTQPRRVAAITVARRIAEEMGEGLGFSVGYKIRFDNRTGRNSSIKIMTDGVLLMETQADPNLYAYDTIIVDEAHERSINIDFILGILKTLLVKRNDLRLIITSATIDSDKFSRAFGDAPVIEVSGRTYPVDVLYWPPEQNSETTADLSDPEAVAVAVERLRNERGNGDILIFMPTERDIRDTCEILNGKYEKGTVILPLFARLPWSEQQRIFLPAEAQKIIVATNIAETSITIPGIRYVIDPGASRISQYNPRTRTNSLPVKGISRSSADQRKGRCGRIEYGLCIRLYSEEEYNNRPLFTPPEILRSNLAGVILKMLSLNLGDVSSFPFIDPPPHRSIQDGLEILRELGAIKRDADNGSSIALTKNGRLMAQIPLDPRLSRMIIEADQEGCFEEIAIIAAALSVQDPRERPAEKEEAADLAQAIFQDPSSDFLTLQNIWKGFQSVQSGQSSRNRVKKYCREHFLSYRRMCEWQDVHEQIRQILQEQKFARRPTAPISDYQAWYAAMHKSILSGYLSNIALKKEKNIYQATKGREAMLFPGSGLFNKGGNWIVAAEIVETSRLFARFCGNIEIGWLEPLGGNLCRSSYSEPRWEKTRGEVVAAEQVSLFGLVIVPRRFVSYGPVAPDEAGEIFIRQALLAGEVRHPFPFLRHNQALIKKIASLEDRLRRTELLVSDEELSRFYEERLPGVYNIRSLQKLVKDRGNDDFLRMRESDVLAGAPDPDELALYPEKLTFGNKIFPLDYRFTPGNSDDGVTVKIPLHLVSVLDEADTEWMVPGLIREKITYLLKGLPKEYRKKLLPLSGACDIIIREMKERRGHFLSSLANSIYRRFGIEIPASAWPVADMPLHLRMRFAVINEKKEEIASGRDLSLLQKETSGQIKSKALEDARKIWEKKGIKDWDFGELPEAIDLKDENGLAGPAYPALFAGSGGVEIRLFQNKEEAKLRHREGVAALYGLHFPEELAHLRKNLSLNEEFKAYAKPLGGPKAIEASIYRRVMKNLFEINVRTPEAFIALAAKIKSQILQMGQEVRQAVLPILKVRHEAGETIRALEGANRSNRPALQFLGKLKDDLSRLAPPDFMETYPLERIANLPRYLRALTIGAQRGLMHLEKALGKASEIQLLVSELQDMLNEFPPFISDEKRTLMDEYRWMIEEYRVSLFAQELKTPFPVSRKKLAEKLREIKRMF